MEAPGTPLTFGDINIVAVTDVHSWVAGHGKHEPALDADYGDVLSFVQELREKHPNVYFVMNGDFVDGTGLSTVPPEHLTPILEQMPFSAINMGNHELYHNHTVTFLHTSGFIDHWNGNYLTTNTYWAGTNKHIGQPYTYLGGTNGLPRVLTFGMLYNFQQNCEITEVKKVQETVRMEWFQKVLLQRDYDAILVLAHMDYVDPLVGFLHRSIRALVGPEMPIQFINGHSHRRGFKVYDRTCTAFEPGRFLDTVGFVSFPTLESVQKSDAPESLFRHVFLNASKSALANAVGNDTKTPEGTHLTDFIHQTQQDMGLEKVLGCTDQSYYTARPFASPDALYGLAMREVLPFNFRYDQSSIFLSGTDALRYDLFKGTVTVDDLIAVNPFEDFIFLAASNVTGSEILASFQSWEEEPGFHFHWSGTSDIDPRHTYNVYAVDFELEPIRNRLQDITGRKLGPPTKWTRENGSAVTTSVVWQDFVVHKWPCSVLSPRRRMEFEVRDNSAFLGYTFLGMAMVCLAFVTLVSRLTTRQREVRREPSPGNNNKVRGYGSLN